jgi:hypothetical protein
MKKEDTAVYKRKELLVKLKAYEQRLLASVKRVTPSKTEK